MRRGIVFLLFSFALSYTSAQDIATYDSDTFRRVLEELVSKGNLAYKISDRDGIKEAADSIESYLTKRKRAGGLKEEDSLEYTADRYKLLGNYYYENSFYDEASLVVAHEFYRRAMDIYMGRPIFENGLDKIPIIHRELAQLYYKEKNYKEALAHTQKAYEAYNKAVSLNIVGNDDTDYLDIQTQMAICLARMGDYKEAVTMIDKLIKPYSATDVIYGEALRKKGKILMLQEESGGKANVKKALKCYKMFFNLKKKDALAHFGGMTSKQREEYWMSIRPFVTDCYRLEDVDAGFLYDVTLFAKGLLLQLDSAGGGRQNIHATWQMIQDKLKPYACAIEFVQYEKYGQQQMGALVLKKTGEPIFVKMAAPDSVMQYRIGGKTVEERIHHIVGANFDNRKIRNAVYNDSNGLFTLIWQKELIHELKNLNEVWFAPDGYMHRLAIEYMLPSSLNQLKCHRLTSTRRLLDYPSTISATSALLVGGINYNATASSNKRDNDESAFEYMRKGDGRNPYTFTYLKNSLKAVTDLYRIRNNQQDTLVIESLATEQCFRELCGEYPVIHVSSHGVFSTADVPQGTDLKPNLCDSTLSHSIIALAGVNKNLTNDNFNPEALDGILSAREISALDMSQTELAILCCCETGLGHITSDGVYGFQRGLKNAGVKAIVCSLWDIYENSSNLFMAVFHYYLKQGKTVPESFQHARDSMIDFESGNTLNINDKVIQEITKTINDNYDEPNYRDAFILIDALE